MNSAILELKAAVDRLSDALYTSTEYGAWQKDETTSTDPNNYSLIGGPDAHNLNNIKDSGLGDIYQLCNTISSLYEGYSPKLAEGWKTSADLFHKIYMEVRRNLSDLKKELELFTDEAYQAELRASRAVDLANDEAEKILAELGL